MKIKREDTVGEVLEHRTLMVSTINKQNRSFWDNRRQCPTIVFTMFCSVLTLIAIALICAILYPILKELQAERVIGENGTEVSLLGFWSVLVLAVIAGICCTAFSWTLTYLDSYEPGMPPPTPVSLTQFRHVTSHSFHTGYCVALLNGVMATLAVIWSLR